jgi:hypothetical protein
MSRSISTALVRTLFIWLSVWLAATPALAQLRIVSYNAAIVTNPAGDLPRAGTSTVLQALGIQSKNGIQRPVDIISLQEVDQSLAGAAALVAQLNSIYGAGTYARSTVAGGSTSPFETQAVIYNTQTVQLLSQTAIGPPASTSGPARQPMRFEFQPVGYDSSANFYVYASHYKAGTTSSDIVRRNAEAGIIRADADALGPGVNAIFTGDYNIDNSSEAMYQTLTAAGGPGQAFDPINAPGSWGNNSAFAAIHTQAPLVTGVDGLTGGGMDDRFDFQQTTAPLRDGEGMSYIGLGVPNTPISPAQHSYHAFGNNGTTFNSNINSGSNTALPVAEYNPGPGQPTRTDALNALTTASDHLPLVADFQLPAKMSASLAAVPAQVIKDTPLSVNLNVSNVAPVAVAIGADELDYNYNGGGSASGAGSGTVLPLSPANVHSLALDTSTLGPQTGNVSATGSSAQVANGVFNDAVDYTVLDHAAGEFVDPTAPQTLDIDFGTVLLGVGSVQQAFELVNLPGLFRAALDLTAFTESGDFANRFDTDLALFSGLAAGSQSSTFHAMLAIDQPGTFSATYLLDVGDEAGVFGGTSETLTLNLFATVAVPEPAGIVLGGLAVAGLLGFAIRWRHRRRSPCHRIP